MKRDIHDEINLKIAKIIIKINKKDHICMCENCYIILVKFIDTQKLGLEHKSARYQ